MRSVDTFLRIMQQHKNESVKVDELLEENRSLRWQIAELKAEIERLKTK